MKSCVLMQFIVMVQYAEGKRRDYHRCVLMQFIVMVQLNWSKGLSSRSKTMISTTEKQDGTVFYDRPFLFFRKIPAAAVS